MIKITYMVLQDSGAMVGNSETKILNRYDDLVKILHSWIMNGVNVSVGVKISDDIWKTDKDKFLNLYKYASLDNYSLIDDNNNFYRLNIYASNY